MSPAGFEPTILAGDRPHTHALDRAVTGIGNANVSDRKEILNEEGQSETATLWQAVRNSHLMTDTLL
jgi:hypothetical protein